MSKTVMANTIFNELFKLAEEEHLKFNLLWYIKAVYLCHGWYLGFYGKSLTTEDPHAWEYGPVYERLYEILRIYKLNDIPYPAPHDINEKLTEEQKEVIKLVYNYYKNYTDKILSGICHLPNSPWDIVYKKAKEKRSGDYTIYPSILREFYAQKIKYPDLSII